MGVSEAPDIATEIMHDTFANMEDVEFYMDDIGCFSDSWDKHLQLLQEVLQHLQSVGFTINPLKCKWAVKEKDFLRHWLTPTGIKPWKKKIDAVLCLKPPNGSFPELCIYLAFGRISFHLHYICISFAFRIAPRIDIFALHFISISKCQINVK